MFKDKVSLTVRPFAVSVSTYQKWFKVGTVVRRKRQHVVKILANILFGIYAKLHLLTTKNFKDLMKMNTVVVLYFLKGKSDISALL